MATAAKNLKHSVSDMEYSEIFTPTPYNGTEFNVSDFFCIAVNMFGFLFYWGGGEA